MRIYLIIVEESFFHPKFVEEIIKGRKKEIVGMTLVPEISPKISKWEYLKQQWIFFGPWPFFYLGGKTAFYKFINFLDNIFPLNKFYSVGKVAKHYKIPIYQVDRVNDHDHLDYLKKLAPDIIISAQGQVFKKELLTLPKIICINRHSAFLPKYGGLWPVFWAMLHGEKKIGVTVHTMVEKIDSGKILAQEEIPVLPGDSIYDLYKKAFKISGKVTLEALEKLEKKPVKFIPYDSKKASYFSLPNSSDAKLFRQKGLKFI